MIERESPYSKLESDVRTMVSDTFGDMSGINRFVEAVKLSQAISLKRIADALETAAQPLVEVSGYIGAGGVRFPINGPAPAKQTSPEISALAAKYLAMSEDDIMADGTPQMKLELIDDIKKLAEAVR